jgi:hypothetical protein
MAPVDVARMTSAGSSGAPGIWGNVEDQITVGVSPIQCQPMPGESSAGLIIIIVRNRE